LTGEAAAAHRAPDVVLVRPVGRGERSQQDLPEVGAREIVLAVPTVHGDPAAAGLDPDAGDGVLASAGAIGTTLGIDLRLAGRLVRLNRRGATECSLQIGERMCIRGHAQELLLFLEFSTPTSSGSGCRASCG